MARPTLEAFLDRHPKWTAVVTFFSPSGFEPRRHYPRAEVFYLPPDAPSAARHWLHYCRPTLAVFVRYDLWPHHLRALRQQGVPTAVIAFSAPRTPWYLRRSLPLLRRTVVQAVTLWGTVSEADSRVLSAAGVHSTVLGNPKFDDALERAATPASPRFEAWKKAQQRPVLLVGSAHRQDIVAVLGSKEVQRYSVWIVPHKVDLPLSDLVSSHWPSGLASPLVCKSTTDSPQDTGVLLIPEFGLLASLYALADVVFIGGGFGKSPHNVLEATAHGKVAACGPHWKGASENPWLRENNWLHPVSNEREWSEFLTAHANGHWTTAALSAREELQKQRGASERIVRALEQAVEL